MGRERELGLLAQAIELARAGQGQVVVVEGSAGMGKTALCTQVAADAPGSEWNVLWGRCRQEPGAPALWPWRQLVRQLVETQGPGAARALLGSVSPQLLNAVPELSASTPISPAARKRLAAAPERFEVFDAITTFWRRASASKPCLLILEDLQWADPSSLRLLSFLASEWSTTASMVLGTCRDDPADRTDALEDCLADLLRHGHCRRLALSGLTRAETERFVVETAGAWPEESVVQTVYERTEGHPLFLLELLRFMAERKSGAPGAAEMPDGLRAVIGRRLHALEPFVLEVLNAAACIGRDVDLALLAEVLECELDDRLFAALHQALSRRLLEPSTGPMRLRFTHAMIRETIYGALLGPRRAALHQRIGACLARTAEADKATLWPLLAHHFGQAADVGAAAQAIEHAQRAADHAFETFAYEQAAHWYERALALLDRYFSPDPKRRLEIVCGLATAYHELGAGTRCLPLWTEAAELARATGARDVLGFIALRLVSAHMLAASPAQAAIKFIEQALRAAVPPDAPLRTALLIALCRALGHVGRFGEAERVYREAMAAAQALGDLDLLLQAEPSLLVARFPLHLPQRLELGRSCFQRRIREQRHLNMLDLTLPFHAADLLCSGDIAGLKDVLALGEYAARRLPSPYPVLVVTNLQVLLAISEARFADAEQLASQAMDIGRRCGVAQTRSAFGTQMFCIRKEQGRLDEVAPALQQLLATMPQEKTWRTGLILIYAELGQIDKCREEFEAVAAAWARPADAASVPLVEAALLAEVCADLDDQVQAAQLYERLLPYQTTVLVADIGGPCVGAADRLLGMLATVLERWEPARAHFDRAVALDERCGFHTWAAHSRYRLAWMLERRGRKGDLAEARTLLLDLVERCTRLGMRALVARAAALAASLDAPGDVAAYPSGLTRREVELLRLIAIGRSNRECAQVLAISTNTVAAHIRSILHKTFTANRTEAAAFARRHGLLEG